MLRRAQDGTKLLLTVVQALLAVESIVTILGMSYLLVLLVRVCKDRSSLFSVFLAVPNGFLKQLASKASKVSAAEEAESDGGCCFAGSCCASTWPALKHMTTSLVWCEPGPGVWMLV